MGAPASIKEHPIHPAIVGFPIGLWLFSLMADLIYRLGIGGVLWKTVAFYAMAAGIIGALIAAVPGFIDFMSISDRRVRQVGINHLTANLLATALFAISFVL